MSVAGYQNFKKNLFGKQIIITNTGNFIFIFIVKEAMF